MVVTDENYKSIGSDDYLSTVCSPIIQLLFHNKIWDLLMKLMFSNRNRKNQNFKTRFKNQSTDTLKLLGHNCNHQQGFIKQKNCCSPSLWF